MPHLTSSPTVDLTAAQPRARGGAKVSSKRRSEASVIGDLHQSGSMKVVFPRTFDASLQAVFVNTAGGITGGDAFRIEAVAGPDTDLVLTTQAAERAYRAVGEDAGRVETVLRIEAGAKLSWVPQETILFEGSRFKRCMSVTLADDAQFLFVEPLVLGRMSSLERLEDIRFSDQFDIMRDGVPLFSDAVQLSGDVTAQMVSRAGSAGALASVVYVAPDAESCLGDVRALLPRSAGASLLGADLLHIRVLAEDSFVLRQSLMPVLERLRSAPLPRVWRI